MSSTRWLISAKAIPRLLVMVVFPSMGPQLVTTIAFGPWPFWLENKIEASVDRNDSATNDGFCCQVTCSTRSDGLPFRHLVPVGGKPIDYYSLMTSTRLFEADGSILTL